MKRVAALVERLFPGLARSAINARTLARDHGFSRSARERKPVDAAGAPLPWYTYPAIEYLRQFDFSACSVFEYGAGNSTRFWAARAGRVCAVENDPQWHGELSARLPGVHLYHCAERDEYVNCIAREGGSFDLIVIDGRWRRRCAFLAPEHLRAGGMILLDNADRHPDAAQVLRAAGLLQVDFSGFGPINAYTWTTSIFVRADIRLQAGFRDPAPVGGLGQRAGEES
jgi:hypothetical protein